MGKSVNEEGFFQAIANEVCIQYKITGNNEPCFLTERSGGGRMAMIRIRNMMFYGFHGIYEYEREQGQKFFVDVSLETRDNHAAETDKAEDGVDSAHVYTFVRDVVENKRFTLLQSLATEVNRQLLKAFPQCKAATTMIRKPSVPIAGPLDCVEVEVTSQAEDFA